MKRTILIIALVFIVHPYILTGQSLKMEGSTEDFNGFPGEKVFVHYNASLLFAGEYLYYKIYTLNTETRASSRLSKVAYLELVGRDGKAVLKQKIALEGGIGQGDLFVPTSVPSGNYKLIGYTQWMVNGKNTDFFRGDLVLLNPYQGDQSGLKPNSIAGIGDVVEKTPTLEPLIDNNIKMTISGKVMGNRDKVIVNLTGIKGKSLQGNYSVSVRKTEDGIKFSRPTSPEIRLDKRISKGVDKPDILLPELRGDLLVGHVTQGNQEIPVSDKDVAILVPGGDPKFKIARTNENGNFFLNLEKEYSGDEMLAQVVGNNSDYKISLLQDPQIHHSSLNLSSLILDPAMKEKIIERSIHNQIENAYYRVKPDTIIETVGSEIFYPEDGVNYILDEFKRFPTIGETFIEIIQAARITNGRSSNQEFRVRPPEGSTDEGLQPLLLVDGLLVQDHSLFINYPARLVKSIRIIREKYFNGPCVFQGVIAVKTVEGDFYAQRPSPLVHEFKLERIPPIKKYFRQVYNNENKNNRIPDFRYQLAWIPNINFIESNAELWFYTSDIQGKFEVSLEGFQEDGTPVSLRDYFIVK